MKKLIATSVVFTAFGIVAACSQGDAHPPYIGDCDACSHQPISTGGGDAATDTSKPDTGAQDSSTSDSSGNDAAASDGASDAASDDGGNDGALLDTGTGD